MTSVMLLEPMPGALKCFLAHWGELEWRHHGTGMLQAYLPTVGKGLYEGMQWRIHIWHPHLLRPGMVDSGAMHNHRFCFTSTVHVGSLKNTRLHVTDYDKNGSHMLWKIEGASDRSKAVLLPDNYPRRVIPVEERLIKEGESYGMVKGEYHWARQEYGDKDFSVGMTVSTVTMYDKGGMWASLIAPVGTTPVHAFEAGDAQEKIVRQYEWLIADAWLELTMRFKKGTAK